VTFGVIEKDEPILGQLIALAFEAAGHDCLVLRDGAHAARILRAIRLDSIVVDIQRPGLNGVEWLETVVATWPDLPSRTLLLTHTALTPGETARINRLGADVVFRPLSIASVKRLVLGRLQKAGSKPAGGSQLDREQDTSVMLLH
jgi:DNA-binding response OmpR family regulator